MRGRFGAKEAVAAVVALAVVALVGCSADPEVAIGPATTSIAAVDLPSDAPALPGQWRQPTLPPPPPPSFVTFSSGQEWSRHLAITAGIVLEVDPYLRARGLDAATGSTVWSGDAPLTVGSLAYLEVFPTGDAFVVVSDAETVLLDAATGQRRWTGPGAAGAASVDLAGGVVVMLHRTGTVEALSLADGTSRWERSGLAKPDGVVASSGSVAVSNALELDVLDESTGATTWTTPVPAGVGPMAVSDGVVVAIGYVGHVVSGFDLASGAERWTVPLPSFMPCCSPQRRVLAAAGRAVVVDGPGLLSVSLTDGGGAWTQQLQDITSATLVTDRLVSTSTSGLIVEDTTSGTVESMNKVLAVAEATGDGLTVTYEATPAAPSATMPPAGTNVGPVFVLAGYQLS